MKRLLTMVAVLAVATLGLATPAHASVVSQDTHSAVIGAGSCSVDLIFQTTIYSDNTETLFIENINLNSGGCAYIGLRPNWTDCNGAVHLSPEIGVFNPGEAQGPNWFADVNACPPGSSQSYDFILGDYVRSDDTTGHWNPTNSPNGFIDFINEIPPPPLCSPSDCFVQN